MKDGIRDFKAVGGQDSGLIACSGFGTPKITVGISCFVLRVPNRFFGMRDLPYLKAEIRDFEVIVGQDS